jgi:hypothetical protein
MAVGAPTSVCQYLSPGTVTDSGQIIVTANVPAGQYVEVVAFGATAATTFTVTDSQGNTWISAGQKGNVGGTALCVVEKFYCFLNNPYVSGTDWIRLQRTATNSLGFFADTCTGVASVGGTVLVGATTTNNANVTVSGSLTPGTDDLVSMAVVRSNATAGTVGTGYTKNHDAATTSTNARICATEYQQFPSGGSTSPTFTCGGTPQWAAIAVLLVAASGSSPASGTASLDLVASGAAAGDQTGSAALSLSASGSDAGAQTGAAVLSLAASGADAGAGSGSAAVSLVATGAGAAPETGSAALTLNASGSTGGSSPASGSAAVSLIATGADQAPATGTATLTLTASGTDGARGSGAAVVSLVAAGTDAARGAGSAVLSLLASAAAGVRASGQAFLQLLATGFASGGDVVLDPFPEHILHLPARQPVHAVPGAGRVHSAPARSRVYVVPARGQEVT